MHNFKPHYFKPVHFKFFLSKWHCYSLCQVFVFSGVFVDLKECFITRVLLALLGS